MHTPTSVEATTDPPTKRLVRLVVRPLTALAAAAASLFMWASVAAAQVTQPVPVAPPGNIVPAINTVSSWLMFMLPAIALASIIGYAIVAVTGQRNSSQALGRFMSSIGVILVALIVAFAGAAILNQLSAP